MSEPARPIIEALRAWLKTCPLIAEEQTETGAAFRIAGLDEESTAFSIEDSPGEPAQGAVYFSGQDIARNFLFVSRRDYDEAGAIAAQNSGFFEQLTDWVWQQDLRGSLPDLSGCGHGKTAKHVAVTSTGYIVTSAAGSCRMQMQLRLQYYQSFF